MQDKEVALVTGAKTNLNNFRAQRRSRRVPQRPCVLRCSARTVRQVVHARNAWNDPVVIGMESTTDVTRVCCFRGSGHMTNHGPSRGDLMTMAEQELSAFLSAVTELFGSEQAEAAAEDWLRELMASNDLPASIREWRTLTLAAAAQLARRVNGSALTSAMRGARK